MPTKIFVGNIHSSTSEELQTLFEKHGTVSECDIIKNQNYGFVHMPTDEEAQAAISALNGYVLNGNKINVEISTPDKQGRRREGRRSFPFRGRFRGGGNSRPYGSRGGGRGRYDHDHSMNGHYRGGRGGYGRGGHDSYDRRSDNYRRPAPYDQRYRQPYYDRSANDYYDRQPAQDTTPNDSYYHDSYYRDNATAAYSTTAEYSTYDPADYSGRSSSYRKDDASNSYGQVAQYGKDYNDSVYGRGDNKAYGDSGYGRSAAAEDYYGYSESQQYSTANMYRDQGYSSQAY